MLNEAVSATLTAIPNHPFVAVAAAVLIAAVLMVGIRVGKVVSQVRTAEAPGAGRAAMVQNVNFFLFFGTLAVLAACVLPAGFVS